LWYRTFSVKGPLLSDGNGYGKHEDLARTWMSRDESRKGLDDDIVVGVVVVVVFGMGWQP
jgi:hypothetical protein